MIDLIGSIIILIGSVFILIACIGLWRLNGLYMKMHAATKAGTLGCGLILVGSIFNFHNSHVTTSIIVLIFFILLTNPIAAQLIAHIHYCKKNNQQP